MLQPVAIPEAYKVPKMFVVASENFHATHLFKEYWKLEPLVIPQSHDNELHEIDICQPTSSQGKIRFNTFVKCREICKATRKPLYLFANPPQIVKLPLNSYKKTTLPICLGHRKKRNQFCERGVTGGKLYEGFCEVPPPPQVLWWVTEAVENPAAATSKGGTWETSASDCAKQIPP